MSRVAVALLSAFCLAGCVSAKAVPPDTVEAGAPPLSATQVELYLRRVAPMLAGRVLTGAEVEAIEADPAAALSEVVTALTGEPGFAAMARSLINKKLSVGGQANGIDFDLPGNLMQELVTRGAPISELLTADYCVDAGGAHVACDTGAPFAAGVLGTRAYLASRASRFNLTRASTMMRAFACRGYPMESALEPRLPKGDLIPMFRAETAAEQTDPAADSGFGNGSACYSCHGQFAPHAQVFVRFDQTGMWRPSVTGLQDPNGELGRSVGGLFASQLIPPLAASEASQMLGQRVQDLRGAARVLAEGRTYLPCMARNLLEYVLDFDGATGVPSTVLDNIAATASANQRDPSLGQLALAAFTDRRIIDAVLTSMGDPP
jgi:hypothetical protein